MADKTEKCLDCARDINGPIIRTPDGDTYHYACVDVSYPEPCMTGDVMSALTPEGTGEEAMELFEFLKSNPYVSLGDDPVDTLPEVGVRAKPELTVEILGNGMFSIEGRTRKVNISPWLFQAVYFGCALEREFPAFADEDDLYPRGEARVPSEEEEVESTAN